MKTKLLSLPVLIFSIAALGAGSPRSPHNPPTESREGTAITLSQPCSGIASAETKGASRLLVADSRKKGGGPAKAAAPAPVIIQTVPGKANDLATFSSFDRPVHREQQDILPRGALNFEDAELAQVLKVYQSLSGRTVVRPGALPAVKIGLQNETPLTRQEALQALDTVLAQNGITMVLQGAKFVKAVPSAQAVTEAAPMVELAPNELPESSSYLLYVVELKNARAREVVPALQPFSKMPNSIVAIDSAGLLILRDYSANVRRMLQVLDKMDAAAKP